MAGIPHHAASAYIDRITSIGKKVAICEQIEDPKDAIGIVKRAVTQVVSPGMPYDLDKTEGHEHKFMASCFYSEKLIYLILIDYTTGEFFGLTLSDQNELIEKLNLYKPYEIINFHQQWEKHENIQNFIKDSGILETNLSADYFVPKYTGIYIEKIIPAYKRDEIIKLHPDILGPIGALCYYICSTQSVKEIAHIRPFKLINLDNEMKITYPSLVGLEIFPKSRERYKESILGFMDSTKTALGSRKLKSFFQTPLQSKEKIERRQDSIQFFIDHPEIHEFMRNELFEVRDIERIMAKVSTKKSEWI